jgi:tetratricopeptide (TPR) repeat protein
MKWDEREAVGAIDRAIADIKRAAIDDGKNLGDRPPGDAAEPRNGRLHRAMTALQAARRDVSEEEDNAFATGLRARGIHNIDEAIRFTERGLTEADRAPGAAPVPAAQPIVAAAPAPQPMAAAPAPRAHPAYLHALSDLRNARWNLERRGGDPQMKWDEREAVGAIDRALNDIKQAAIDDGKNINDRPPIDARELRGGRLHKAIDALRAARKDVSEEEDNAFANGLKARGIHNIDEAIRLAEQGIGEADRLPAVAGAAPAPPPVATPGPGPQPIGAAPGPHAHPAYLHALSDLRNARGNLERKGGDPQMKWDEREAVGAIERAIADIKQAAIDDGKNLQDHPPVDAREPRAGRLHKAIDALRAARKDVSEEEDNAFANGLRARGIHNIDEAIRFTEQGIGEADQPDHGRK